MSLDFEHIFVSFGPYDYKVLPIAFRQVVYLSQMRTLFSSELNIPLGSAMALVTYVEHDGARHEVEVPPGDSVMQGAVNNMISGIVAECGGALACATCHCYVDDAWIDRVGPPASDAEKQMLECAAAEVKRGSRLSCQIAVNEALDGLVVRLPESQF
jgi:ferredoxin, 2Fe-2S